jgi:hypothetical protein
LSEVTGRIGMLAAAVFTVVLVVVMTACQVGSGPGTPAGSVGTPPPIAPPPTATWTVEPSAAAPRPTPTLVAIPSLVLPSPTPNEASQAAPTSGVEIPPGSYIALYKAFLAGDYHAVCVTVDGQAEYTRHTRTYDVIARKQGTLGPAQVGKLFALLTDKGFFELEDEYRLSPADEGEEVYYWVGASEGQREKTVLAHERAMPPGLNEITMMLFDTVLELPDEQTPGTFLLALDYRLLPVLRVEEGMPRLELDDQRVTEVLPLEVALRRPGSLVRVENPAQSEVVQFYPAEGNMIEVVFNGRPFVVLLLKQE